MDKFITVTCILDVPVPTIHINKDHIVSVTVSGGYTAITLVTNDLILVREDMFYIMDCLNNNKE